MFLRLGLEAADIPRLAQGGAQPFVNQKMLNALFLPLCSEEEQVEIAYRYGILNQMMLETAASAETAEMTTAQLRQAVLKAAFEGRLVPQHPDDEPASALLARLHEIATRQKAARRRGRQTAVAQPSLPGLTDTHGPRQMPRG
jgi:type I restriction enzyme S subunit